MPCCLSCSSNQFHTKPGPSSTTSASRTSPVGRPVLPVPDRSTYCQLLGGGLYSPTSPKVTQLNIINHFSINADPTLCLFPDKPSYPRSVFRFPTLFILALSQPHPSCSFPLPAEPRALRSQCEPAGATTERSWWRGETRRRRAAGERRVGRRREARGEATSGPAATDTQRAPERRGASLDFFLCFLCQLSGFVHLLHLFYPCLSGQRKSWHF